MCLNERTINLLLVIDLHLLQFYRVEVKVLPPEADAAPRTRSVLRRFSHFTKLHARVSIHLCYCLFCQHQDGRTPHLAHAKSVL